MAERHVLFGRAAKVIWPGGKCCFAGRQGLFGQAKLLLSRAARVVWPGGNCYLSWWRVRRNVSLQ